MMGKSDEKDHLREAAIDVSIILKWFFKKWNVGLWTGKGLLMIGTVHGNELSGSINYEIAE